MTIAIGFFMVLCSFYLKIESDRILDVFNGDLLLTTKTTKEANSDDEVDSKSCYQLMYDTFLEYYDVYKIRPIKHSFFHAIVVYLVWNCVSSPIAFDLLESPYIIEFNFF